MEFCKRKLSGTFEISLLPHKDERGFFMRAYDELFFKNEGLNFHWVQENHSRSEYKGVIRGLHFQFMPYSETKLVRCIRGAIMDVFVDLSENSPTFGQWDSIELSEFNKKMILIPRGFAHGFCTLTDESEVVYKVDNFYNREAEGGLMWNDPQLAIKWPVKDPILSQKDSLNLSFNEFKLKYGSIRGC
jgi:dTDP-4-dehydrorhamnose 3,5-epimerase